MTISSQKKILLVLDEYQYLKNSLKENEMDSYMQIIIDSLPANIKLVLCGSDISIMKELLTEENPLFGRFSTIISLEEFDYYDAALFYPNLPVHKKIEFYCVFGGSPYVLSNLDYSKSVAQNIKKLLIDSNSLLHSHISNVMLREIQKSYDVRIFQVLGNGSTLKTLDGYDFYEAKFYKKPMKLLQCETEESQIRTIPNLPCDKIGFVCLQGFAFESKKYKLISGEDLFKAVK